MCPGQNWVQGEQKYYTYKWKHIGSSLPGTLKLGSPLPQNGEKEK